ncbi:hypothetical protein [Cyclobacterium jeungdonense]|uniref:Quinate/shikimate 5-dehydrogenase/glutamyl-tRNA reductase domain-containing protein n=1 Tax=Cyclobacterium jeungdonense TaxID=708087 RepID=A0ABT8CEP7_9BACT|nr:hypothetical protein [Cyclobacterium jeungdonense]MDN3690258.1 hypothetical protein [Cyclobacterium jeungdonense]
MGQFRLLSFSTGLQKDQESGFQLTPEEIRGLLQQMKQWPELGEALVLSNPERTEILYFSSNSQEDEIYQAIRKIKLGDHLPEKTFFQQNCNEECGFSHLTELCFGVQATTYGSVPLYAAFMDALELSVQAGMAGPLLSEWRDYLKSTNHFLIGEVSYQAPNFSISFTVSDMVSELVKKIKQPKIAIIGFNALGKKVFQKLKSKGFENIVIVEKNIQSFAALDTKELNQFIYEPIEQVGNVIQENDILISTLEEGEDVSITDYTHTNFSSMKVLIDLAVKSNKFDLLKTHSHLIFFELSDIYQVIQGKMEINKRWLKKAKPLLAQRNKHFFQVLDKKKGEDLLETAKQLLIEIGEADTGIPKMITIEKPLVKRETISHASFAGILAKSLKKIQKGTTYKDLVSYDRLVNEFFLRN